MVPVLSECNIRKANSDGLSPTDAELVREKSTVGGGGSVSMGELTLQGRWNRGIYLFACLVFKTGFHCVVLAVLGLAL